MVNILSARRISSAAYNGLFGPVIIILKDGSSGLRSAGPSFETEKKAKDFFRRLAENLAGKELTGSALGNL
jgi:hypothetical protein